MNRCGFILLEILTLVSSLSLGQTETDKPVRVKLIVRGPDAHLVANRAIEIKTLEEKISSQSSQTVTTDFQGVAQFNVKAGYFSIAIFVHDIGYGITAPASLKPGETGRLKLPLPAGYGSMDGMTPSTCPPGAFLILSSAVNANRSMLKGVLRARADQSGNFHIADIPGGNWFIFAGSDDQGSGGCGENHSVYVKVGENLKGVTLLPLMQAPSTTPPAKTQTAPAPSSSTTAAQQAKPGAPGSSRKLLPKRRQSGAQSNPARQLCGRKERWRWDRCR